MSHPCATFDHYCPDWDFLRITETDPEFAACQCSFGTMHEQERLAAKMDLARKEWEQFPDEGHGFPAQGNLFPDR